MRTYDQRPNPLHERAAVSRLRGEVLDFLAELSLDEVLHRPRSCQTEAQVRRAAGKVLSGDRHAAETIADAADAIAYRTLALPLRRSTADAITIAELIAQMPPELVVRHRKEQYEQNARGHRVRKECADCGHHQSAHAFKERGWGACRIPGCPCTEFRRPQAGERVRRHKPNARPRPDAGPPYTLEELNELTGSRVHRKATVYTTREDALSRMREKVRSMRPFAVVSVLDRAGNEVESARGEAGGSSQQKNPSSRHRAGEVLAGRADPGGGTPIANASEVDFFEDNRFVKEGPLWQFQFGAYADNKLYVWADGMGSAFEIAVEWLDDHAPGLLVMVGEEDYQQAANELGKVWDPSDPDDEIMQTAEADMTMIGHTTLTHGNAVPSWEWHAHEVERGSPEWNEVVERSREESGSDDSDEYEENASLGGREMELLSGLAVPPIRRKVPGPGDSVVYDRSYQELANRGLITWHETQPGVRSFSDYYVLTPKGKEVLRTTRLPSWAVREK